MQTIVSSATKEVSIGGEQSNVITGERINPSGKKKLAQALKAETFEIVCNKAATRVQTGADILDVRT
jgi:5-methyltetrahydrofolate--homocysteine methyltransferase